jgi:hypothetical protein
MRLPTIQGVIRRRILVNYRVDPEIIKRLIPRRFVPKLHDGFAIAGICLIRLEDIRPAGFPAALGVNSENAAHRIAVRWEDDRAQQREGVFIPRRDTDSKINQLLGGRVFPGEHHAAGFEVNESPGRIEISMKSADGKVMVGLCADVSDRMPESSVFRSVSDASQFFEPGSLGFSATADPGRLDGIELETKEWRVGPLQVDRVSSSFFDDRSAFPEGSVQFDHALLMRNIAHEWHSAGDMYL